MARLRRIHPLLRLFTVLWLPFCCCQWQGIAAAWSTDGGSIEVSCGSACCQGHAPAESASPEAPEGDQRCSLDCCIRGEVPPPAWEPPVDRIGVDRAFSIPSGATEAARVVVAAHAHPPPIDASPPKGVPVDASVRLQV
ncbi:MAG: hypothetical protein ACO3EP_02975 [Phycisphaerales bacterium]